MFQVTKSNIIQYHLKIKIHSCFMHALITYYRGMYKNLTFFCEYESVIIIDFVGLFSMVHVSKVFFSFSYFLTKKL